MFSHQLAIFLLDRIEQLIFPLSLPFHYTYNLDSSHYTYSRILRLRIHWSLLWCIVIGRKCTDKRKPELYVSQMQIDSLEATSLARSESVDRKGQSILIMYHWRKLYLPLPVIQVIHVSTGQTQLSVQTGKWLTEGCRGSPIIRWHKNEATLGGNVISPCNPI